MPDFAADQTAAAQAADAPAVPVARPGEPRSRVLTERLAPAGQWLEQIEPERIREEVESGIRAHPLLSVALAVCAGFLVGRLIRE